ncbi:MAG: LuxR family transcriptional regulator [Raoultibacter sp.]
MDRPKRTATALTRLATTLEPSFPLRLLGFGLIYVWSSCLWETPIFSPIRVSTASGDMFSIWLLSACLTPIACIVCAFAGRKRELTEYPALFFTAPLLAVIGTICVALYPHSPESLHVPLAVIAGIGTGVGPAIMIVLWVGLYASLDIEVTETVVPASFLLIVVCMLVFPYLSAPIAIPLAILLPIISGILLVLSRNTVPTSNPALSSRESEGTSSSYPLASMLRTFLLILVAYAISCSVSFLQEDTMPLLADATATVIGMLFVLFSARIDLEVYFRWMSAPLILSVVFAAFPNSLSLTISAVLANAMFTSLEIIMILYFIRLAHKTKRPASFFIGIGVCATYTGLLIGYLLGIEGASLIAAGQLNAQTICLVLVGVFAVAMLLVPRKDSAWTGGHSPALASTASTADSAVDAEPSISPPITFDMICDNVAQRHKLSARETEVFKLMAQGRSQPYIREVLYLSKNTVSTHIKHIYRKLDIHSKEELIDMVTKS